MHKPPHIFGTLFSLFIFSVALTLCSLSSCRQEKSQPSVETIQEIPQNIEVILPVYEIPYTDSAFIQHVLSSDKRFDEVGEQVMSFYEEQEFKCAWFGEYGLSEQAGKIVNLLSDYFAGGVLDSTILVSKAIERYRLVSEAGFSPIGKDSLVIESDILFTSQFFLAASKAWKGIDSKKARDLQWFMPLKQVSFTSYLREALRYTDAVVKTPVLAPYNRLLQKLKDYNTIKKNGGWEELELPASALSPGDSSDFIPNLRHRLFITGEYISDTTSILFDDSLANAIALSRKCFGLRDIALIDDNYLKELNVSVDSRIRQMLLNLERWKWLPVEPSSDFIAVNIPEYMLHVFSRGQRIKSMRVIVGKEVSQTVIFSGTISSVVFSPYWNIPRSIMAEETLPAIRKNKNYLTRNNMEIVTRGGSPKAVDPSTINWSKYNEANFPYSIRQKPGTTNSLGHVKFLFPNSYAIYLHDTPSRYLFERETRMFSHGCIRIAEPAWLAEFLLEGDSSWTAASIEKAMHSGTEKYVTPPRKLPVYITYFTSWVDSDGRLNFRKDIYGHDRKMMRELFAL